jgi:hypothetical protein
LRSSIPTFSGLILQPQPLKLYLHLPPVLIFTSSQSMNSSQIINIVRLDGIHFPSPTFSPSFKHTYTEYSSTPSDTRTIFERIKDADVVITTRIPMTEETLEECPRLKHVAVLAIGLSPLQACLEVSTPNPLHLFPMFFSLSRLNTPFYASPR